MKKTWKYLELTKGYTQVEILFEETPNFSSQLDVRTPTAAQFFTKSNCSVRNSSKINEQIRSLLTKQPKKVITKTEIVIRCIKFTTNGEIFIKSNYIFDLDSTDKNV